MSDGSTSVAPTSPRESVTHLLPQLQDLEPLEVVQLPPLLERSALLGPGALVELLLDLVLLPLLRNVTDTGGAGQLGDDDRSEGELGEGNFLTGDGGLLGGTINKDLCLSAAAFLRCSLCRAAYALVVDDLDNGGQTTLVDTLVEEDDTADLDQPPGARCDVGVTHFVDCAVVLLGRVKERGRYRRRTGKDVLVVSRVARCSKRCSLEFRWDVGSDGALVRALTHA